jgi:septal ring factor EnvC (AmiA/AmiB activator)
MSTPASALQTLAQRIFVTAKGHAYDANGSQDAIATILESEGLTPAVLAASAVATTAAVTAQQTVAVTQAELEKTKTQLGMANETITALQAKVKEHETTIAASAAALNTANTKVTNMKALASQIAAA